MEFIVAKSICITYNSDTEQQIKPREFQLLSN